MLVETEEGWFSPDPDTQLFTKTWKPPQGTDTKAHLAFVHGFSDHCNAYYNFFPTLAARGIVVSAFDQRGWGRSVSTKAHRGDSGPTSTVLSDIRSFLNHVVPGQQSPGRSYSSKAAPLFLMGHSMGGAEVLLLSLLQSQPQPVPHVSGLLLESPYIALHPSAQPTAFTVLAGKLASKILPKRQLLQKLESKHLCRDQEVCQDWEADELCHDTGTLEGLSGMLQRAADLTSLANGQKVQAIGLKPVSGTGAEPLPVWIGHGTEDRVTSYHLSQAIIGKLDVEDKTLKLYKGAYHKLHIEPDGVAGDFADDVATWILERTNSTRGNEQGGDDVRSKL